VIDEINRHMSSGNQFAEQMRKLRGGKILSKDISELLESYESFGNACADTKRIVNLKNLIDESRKRLDSLLKDEGAAFCHQRISRRRFRSAWHDLLYCEAIPGELDDLLAVHPDDSLKGQRKRSDCTVTG